MAFSGLHVACGYAGATSLRESGLSLLGKVVWAQTMVSAGATTNSAPAVSDAAGQPIFTVRASADSFVAIGPAPDASQANGPRIFVPAGERVEFYAQPGDKLAWVAA